jgi:hypothetical protein
MPIFITELFDLVSDTCAPVSDRHYIVDDEKVSLSAFIQESLDDVKSIVFRGFSDPLLRYFPEVNALKNGYGTFFDSASRNAAIELLWHHFSFLIETGLDPHYYAHKSGPESVARYQELLRQAFLRRDVSIIAGECLLPPEIHSTVAQCVDVACMYLYLYELGHAMQKTPKLKQILAVWFESIGHVCLDDGNPEIIATEFAAGMLLKNMPSRADTDSYLSWAYISTIWTVCTPIIGEWTLYEEGNAEISFSESIAIRTEGSAHPVERIKAVFRAQKSILAHKEVSPYQEIQWMLIASRGLASERFVFELLNIHANGDDVKTVSSKYAHIFYEISGKVEGLLGRLPRESLLPKGLPQAGKLHHYENPYYSFFVRKAVDGFMEKLNKLPMQLPDMEVLGSTMPLSGFNACVIPQMSSQWPTAIVMLQEGLCDVFWHTLSLVVQKVHVVFDEAKVDDPDLVATKAAPGHVSDLQALLLAEPGARAAMYEESVRSHTAPQKIFLSTALETAYCFIVGHEIAHVLYADESSRKGMIDYITRHGVEAPSGPTAEEEICDTFSALLLLNSEPTKFKKMFVQLALLWTASFFVIPEWLDWNKRKEKDNLPSFATFLARETDNIHPIGIRRFFTASRLFRTVLPEFESNDFLIMGGCVIFTALDLNPKTILQDGGFEWPKESPQYVIDIVENPDDLKKNGSGW